MRERFIFVFSTLLLTASVSCASPDPFEIALASIDRGEELWLQRRPVGYVMVLQRACECTSEMSGPALMFVTRRQGSTAVSPTETTYRIDYVASGMPVPEEYARHFPNVQELFELARQAVRQGARVEITTDRGLGYPTWLLIDPDPIGADDEIGWRILELQSSALPAAPRSRSAAQAEAAADA